MTSTVVFLHGWTASPGHYRDVLREMRRHASVYAPILPGHGGRGIVRTTGEGVLPKLADDAASRVPASFSRYAVVGHSLGAGVAVQMALRYPQRVSSLLLVCPIGGDGDVTPRGHVRLVRGSVRDARHRRATGTSGGEWETALRMLRHPLFTARVGLAAKRAHLADALGVLVERGLPIVVYTGEEDTITLPLPHVDGVVYESGPGGHTWLMHEPERFAGWLSRHVSTSLCDSNR